MKPEQIEQAKTIAFNFCVKSLKECFQKYIEEDKPQTKFQWEQLIDDAIHAAHEEAWTVFRHDEKLNELVFVNLSDGKMKYECTMDNETLPQYFSDHERIKWNEIDRFKRKKGVSK
ncbi:hypothetical protein FHR92_001050 [Fontibacillus solani]|uniref:Uncharacterized protein n=1 Tax=Fontibacillus solani TaxID=1572857 RepID=A0A7W3SR90_9BACL|nr:hypothetical protein [Fontibacillus solani]MBA9084593.1 hypothetical protein [Fontibacillus solani]